MKRVLIFCFVSVLLLGLLAGCGMDDLIAALINKKEPATEQTPVQTQPVSETKPTAETVPVTEPVETQAVTTEPADPTPQPVDGNLVNTMTNDERYELNIFLSNFAEAHFDTYPADAQVLLNFAFKHMQFNNYSAVSYDAADSDWIVVSKESIDSVLYRFFGQTVATSEPSCTFTGSYGYDFIYENGYFKCHWGKYSESNNYFTVADEMYKNSDGTYTVSFTVYCAGIHGSHPNSYYFLSPAEVANMQNITYCYSGTAIVKDLLYGNEETYQLLKMETTWR